ncbi:MAG TPA: CARDB domain-containing protein [Vicinamibacterales bacterium]|nr:CARDB domain-containing protein [Vicinamibacterales bacterium]
MSAVFAAVAITLADPNSPMTISDVDNPDPIASGGQLTYTVTMVNTGGSKVTNAVMTDQLNGVGGIGVPPQLQITSTRGSCTQNTNLVTCNGGSIDGNGSWTVTIRGVVTAANGTAINNTASITGTRSAQNFTSTTTTSTLVSNGTGTTLPDLTIAKTGPTSVVVSSPMTYTLTVNNQGTANATGVKVVDTVPAGLTGITASGTSLFTCGVVAQTVTCTGGAVNQGSNATITINATAPTTTGAITNTAAVDPDNTIPESDELNNTSALVDTQVVSAPTTGPLTINLTDNTAEIAGAGPDPVTPAGTETYKILVTNAGSTRADDVTIVDGTQGLVASSVQASFVVTNGTVGTGGGCSVAAPQTKCLARTLNPGGTILMTISGQVIASAGSTIIDTATVTGNVKNTGVSATDTELTTVKPGVDLTITKADAPDPVCARSWPGNTPAPLVCRGGLTYTFVVGNSGINPVSGIVVRDPLMPGLIFDSFSAPAFSGGCAVDAQNVVTCTGGALGPESTTTLTMTLVAPSAVGTITNIVTVDPNNAIFEADETNNSATATTQVVTGIDLTVSKTDAIDPIATSGTETYTIKVNNLGTQDAANIRVRDTLPSGTIFRDVVSDHGFTCSFASGVVECVGGSIKGTASNNYAPLGGNLANPPDTAIITLRIFAQSFAGTMHNEVRVDPLNEIAEADETNNIATQDTVVGSFPTGNGAFNQLTIGKTQVSPANPVARNAKVTYAITVGNTGTDPAVGVTVRDFLPAGARYIEATGTNQFLCSQVGGFINCVGGQIPSAGTATITVSEFAPDTPATYVNQAIVDPDNTIPEGDELDNQASATTIVQNGGNGPFNDLSITKTGTATTTPGGPINYTLVVSNSGSDAASNVSVRDVLPVGETFVSASDAGLGTGAAFTCSQAGGVVNCTGATIVAGGTRTIAITATAPNFLVPAPGLHNTAVVDPDNTIPEGDEFNNTASADTVVSSVINLTITKEGPTKASQSDVTDYTIVVTNEPVNSPDGQVAFGVRMHDPLPVGLIPLAVDAGTGNNWACQILQNPINVVDCLGDLPPKAENKVTIKVTVFVTAENGRVLDNVACVDPANTIAESNENDNCSDFGAFVAPAAKQSPDLIVSKNVDKATTTPGDDLTYTISISNSGNAKAKGWDGTKGLTLSDTLPNEVTFTNATPNNGWTCLEATGTVTCHDNGTGMDPGGSAQVTILAHVKDSAAIPIANTASAAPALVDTTACSDPTQCEDETVAHLINNDSTVVSAIGSTGFDLAIATITDNPDPVAPGQGLKYTVVAVNGGTAKATAVHIELDLPSAGVTFSGAAGSNGFTCGAPASNKVDCVGDLPGGGNTQLTVSFITLLSGLPPSVTLTAIIDPANAFAETNEGNNQKSQTTTITTTGTCTLCVDLVASQLLTSPEPVANNGTVTVQFQVVNIGDTPTTLNAQTDPLLSLFALTDLSLTAATPTSSNPAITCAIDSSGANFEVVNCKGNLQPGEGVTVTLTIPNVKGTEFLVTGTADPNLLVLEFNENNNSLTQTIVIF